MECNWDSLLKKVRAAQDLDQIISAHDTFLQQITSQSLLDEDGQVQQHGFELFMYLVLCMYVTCFCIACLLLMIHSTNVT